MKIFKISLLIASVLALYLLQDNKPIKNSLRVLPMKITLTEQQKKDIKFNVYEGGCFDAKLGAKYIMRCI